MRIEQVKWGRERGWQPQAPGLTGIVPQLVLLFGETAILKERTWLQQLQQAYPTAHLLGCSTAGEICDTQVTDGSLVVTAVQLEHSQIQGHFIHIQPGESSYNAGQRLAQSFETEGLVHLFVISDGLVVNGSELVRGVTQQLPATVTVTGGLSGDGARFQETLVVWDEQVEQGLVAAIGLYGDRLKVGCGSLGGWIPFGPKRVVTRAQENVLYELDGQSALELYKKYLGEFAAGLPSTGLLFPLCLYDSKEVRYIVRTILAVNEAEQSLTFAGDVPEGTTVQLMQASFDRLVDGAIGAAEISLANAGTPAPELAILISCVGRKLVLQQRIEEEVEGVREILGQTAVLTGFYSYGEISPERPGASCELHNQTMTITTLTEV